MRKILFRGKRVDNGEWVYGDLLRMHGVPYIYPDPAPNGWNDYEVIPDTVGQFTGLLDKNGKEIYEGDVLSVLYNLSLERENVCVVYGGAGEHTPGFYFSDDGTTDPYHTWDFRDFVNDVEVIGNIHNNPELMKQNE